MEYLELLYKEKRYTHKKEIEDIFEKEKFYWLIDSELENAKLEIKNNTLIWHSGTFFVGNWYYGIFKDGIFHGTWENGIWEGGTFKGKWISGVKISQTL